MIDMLLWIDYFLLSLPGPLLTIWAHARIMRAYAVGSRVPAAGHNRRYYRKGAQVGIGTSIFLIAVGAILKYAVTATVSGVSLSTVGLILIIVGAAGLVRYRAKIEDPKFGVFRM